MKNIFKNNKTVNYTLLLSLGLSIVLSLSSCDPSLDVYEYKVAEANSIADKTPPSANFSYLATPGNFKQVKFTNLSGSANTFLWDFGDGNTSTDKEPTNVFAAGEGTYKVKLTAKDGNDASAEITIDVVVVDKLIPMFLNKSFEDADRSVWGGGTVSSPYSGSGSPTPPDGINGAKLGANSTTNFLDQTIRVSAKATYKVSFYYVSKAGTGAAGNLLIEDPATKTAFVKEAVPLSPDASNYIQVSYTFTTSATTQNIRFYMTAGAVESRFDLVEIKRL